MRPLSPIAAAGALLALAALTIPAAAQSDVGRFERQLERMQRDTRMRADQSVSADQRALFDWGGYLSLNYLSVDDQDGTNRGLRQYDLVAYARLNLDGVHDFYASVRSTWQDFNPGDSFDGEGDDYIGELDRLYYKFDLARYYAAYKGEKIDFNLVFTGGRQLVYWANGLVLSQVLDAAVVDLEVGPFELEVLAAITPTRTVDFDSSRPHFDDHTRRGFYGAMLSAKTGTHKPYAYALFQQDYNHDDTLSLGIIDTRFEYYSYYLGFGSTGSIGDRLLYGIEAVYEGGSTKSNSFEPDTFFPQDQTEDDIQAWAVDFRLDYLFNDRRKTRLSFETIVASGDADRLNANNTFGGNAPGTKDNGFNAFGLLNTGLAFAPAVSNVAIVRFGATTFPFPDHHRLSRLQVGADFFVFAKTRQNGAIDEPTTSDGHYLGVEPDVYLNWQVTSDVTLTLRYGVFFPNSDVVVSDDVRQFVFGGLTFSF
ncbi:MAG TPA: alginate export family protein [Tepidisphaeraceae bacterium]|nr:alginate export family protein [Tepidisphaeraceae bacterium]